MKFKTYLAIILVLLTISIMFLGCAVPPEYKEEYANAQKFTVESNITMIVFEEVGVVCWVYDSMAEEAGISCLPISQTKLDTGRIY